MRASRLGWRIGVAMVVGVVTAAPTAAIDDEDELLLFEDTLWVIGDSFVTLAALDRLEGEIPDYVTQIVDDDRLFRMADEDLQLSLDYIATVDGPNLLREYDERGIDITGVMWDALWGHEPGPVPASEIRVAYDDALSLWWAAGGSELDPFLTPFPERIDQWLAAGAPRGAFDIDPGEKEAAIEAGGGSPVSDSGVQPIAPEIAATDPAPEPDSDSDSDSTMPWIAGGVAMALALVGFVWWLWSQRSGAGQPASVVPERPEDVLEAGRRFLTADTLDELGERIAEHATRVSGAAGAVFMHEGRTWTSGATPSLADDAIERAGSTGRPQWDGDDAVVAVLSAGRVVGLIGVAGPTNGIDAVEQMAPFAGERLANVVEQAETEQLAFMDGLTSVPNRRRFDLDLSHHSQQAAGGGLPVAVAMIDVDHFKAYNDTNGHQEGDDALRAVARLIGEALRTEDTVYRYGGEEFAVLLPGADLEAALGVAERIRANVEGHRFRGGPNQPGGRVTVSIGVSATPPPDGEVMVEAADAALYRAKTQGRNQVVLAAD